MGHCGSYGKQVLSGIETIGLSDESLMGYLPVW